MTAPEFQRARDLLLPDDAVRLRLKRTDKDIWWGMQVIDQEILDGRLWITSLIRRQAKWNAVSRHTKELRDWVAKQQNNQRSIYWCYRP
jgi:hypothetical protein